jgi:hypothetical protein
MIVTLDYFFLALPSQSVIQMFRSVRTLRIETPLWQMLYI